MSLSLPWKMPSANEGSCPQSFFTPRLLFFKYLLNYFYPFRRFWNFKLHLFVGKGMCEFQSAGVEAQAVEGICVGAVVFVAGKWVTICCKVCANLILFAGVKFKFK